MPSTARKSYGTRAASHPSAIAKRLLETMERKQTNLCVSADLTTKADLLRVVAAVAPYCCLIKTHIDIVSDFDADLVEQLVRLGEKHDVLFFEDRKFADIGNTVRLQYSSGIYRISSWAHIVNAHALPGDGIVSGLHAAVANTPLAADRGLILLAEMSSKGSLATGGYTRQTVDMARRHPDFVFGFIAQSRVHEVEGDAADNGADYLILSPGVNLETKGDGLGQQYRTPKQVVGDAGCDVCIVGRGVYGNGNDRSDEEIRAAAERYRAACWQAYVDRLAR